MKKFILLIIVVSYGFFGFGQKNVSGVITNLSDGEPIPGVSITVKNYTDVTIFSDAKGNYNIEIPDGGTVLIFNYFGMKTKTVDINNRTVIDVELEFLDLTIDDVVVTALGIKREKKALGYSVQDVKGEDISKSNPDNVVSALSGNIAGAQIITSSGQVGASSTISIRGNKTFTGSTQPLFVVDGTPIMNGISSARSSTTSTDFGNAAMDINPANVVSISVLKGASATALYGSRAANGVILITTKKGSGTKKAGLGIDYSASVSISDMYILPNYQNEYGQGMNSDEYNWQRNYSDLTYQEFVDDRGFKWATDGSGRQMDADESWGARLDAGLNVPQMDSPLDADGNVIPTPWISHPNNVKDFYETGITFTNNIALSASNDILNARLTIGNSNQKGTSPNTDQNKTNIGLNSEFKLSDKLSVNINVTYTKLVNNNLPQQENSMRNPLLEFNSWFGRQVDMNYLKEHYDDIVIYGRSQKEKSFNWMMAYGSQHPNPYWNAYKNTMSRERDRVFGNTSITYNLFDGIDIIGRIGTDFFNEHRKYIYHKYSRDWTPMYDNAKNGNFWEQYRFESETNADLFLQINKHLSDDLRLFSTLGGNYRNAYDQFATTYGTNLIVPDFFSTSNFEGEPVVSFTKYQSVTNSVFGSANLGFKNYVFLEFTLRGDWSSTLPAENRNYWYPSVNVGFIINEAFNLTSKTFTYGKIRAGYAVVGNATSPYQLNPVFYSVGTTFNDINLFSAQSTLPTANLKPEKTNSLEIGGEFKFFENRLGIDLAYYNTITKDQLIRVDVPTSSGYSSWMKNAGSIRNKGVELQVYGTVLKKQNLSWDVTLNWSTNKNTVIELADNLKQLQISYYYSKSQASLMAFPGEEWGTIYGTTFKRDSVSGDVLIDQNGKPITTEDPQILGYVNPDWIGGIRNTVTYKRFSLSALIDFRMGGDIFSMTKAVGQKTGILDVTTKDGIREDGMVVDGIYEDGAMVDLNGDGTTEDASGQANQTVISAQSYWGSSRSWGELAIIDGSFIKFRELSLTYNIPKKIIKKIKIQNANISLYGRNLALLYTDKSNDAHIDPEVSSGGTISGIGIETYQLPSARTLGFKLNIKF